MYMTEETSKFRHKPADIALVVLAAVAYTLCIVFNALAASPAGVSTGLYLNNTGDIADYFYLEITPAGWMFSVWGFIYTWQYLWIIYGIINIFRRTDDGYFYAVYPIMPPAMYAVFTVNNIANVVWLILWDRLLSAWALPCIALVPFTLYICLFISFRRLNDNKVTMINQGYRKDVWLTRFLTQNGMAFYATWTTIATLLNVAIVMTYDGSVAMETSCTAVLGILAVELLFWFTLDNFVLDKFTRYLFSPFIIILLALTASLVQGYDPTKTNKIFTMVLLGIASVMAITKVAFMIWRHRTRPLEN
ncbi:uncharacterized protein LOC106162124 [Lingula anatina]|uniref:Uncharacterized protein LOC106162124 n=1 Tax=Lingula anatina TaxID=7574 RepID=A0A1S3I8Y8_LINAN|nr:uncharacterized protein LOC106162124 [Lingula anatina]|eukprot:XP_013394717.1 uncharacterized protein LOC106162124 [Lingula anatina]